jgi:hypothetical protein
VSCGHQRHKRAASASVTDGKLQGRQRTCRTPNDGDALKTKVVEQLDHGVSLIFQRRVRWIGGAQIAKSLAPD